MYLDGSAFAFRIFKDGFYLPGAGINAADLALIYNGKIKISILIKTGAFSVECLLVVDLQPIIGRNRLQAFFVGRNGHAAILFSVNQTAHLHNLLLLIQ